MSRRKVKEDNPIQLPPMEMMWQTLQEGMAIESSMHSLNYDSTFKGKATAVAKALKTLEDAWEGFTRQEMEFFLTHMVEPHSEWFFFNEDSLVDGTYGVKVRDKTKAAQQFTARLKALRIQFHGIDISSRGAKPKIAAHYFVHSLLLYWTKATGLKPRKHETHDSTLFIERASKTLKSYGEQLKEKHPEGLALLEALEEDSSITCGQIIDRHFQK